MKYKKIILVVLAVLGCFLLVDRDVRGNYRNLIDKTYLKDVDYLMIVAHPDDETIWGGQHLLNGRYFVVCLTNGSNKTRKKEFVNVMKATHNQGLMLDYPDKTNGQRDNWYKVKDDIQEDIHYILEKKKWKMIVTHNPDGEYGHIHHRMTSKLVSQQDNIDQNKLMYFGKYYKKKNKPANLLQINAQDLEKKMELVKLYGSQSKVMDHLGHMMSHENWIKAKEWG